MPAVKPARGARPTWPSVREYYESDVTPRPQFELREWLRTDRGKFYRLVGREVYSHEWDELTDAQRDHVGHVADTLAAALNVGWTKRGTSVRPPLQHRGFIESPPPVTRVQKPAPSPTPPKPERG
jgi:hypothetical protein